MNLVEHLIDRLEIRRMSVDGLRCSWCPSCLRVTVRDDSRKGTKVEVLSLGEEGCRQTLEHGDITDCIASLKEEAALRTNG